MKTKSSKNSTKSKKYFSQSPHLLITGQQTATAIAPFLQMKTLARKTRSQEDQIASSSVYITSPMKYLMLYSR